MTDKTNDAKAFEQLDKEKRSQAKDQLVKEAQDELISRIQGGKKETYSWEKKGKTGPDDYDEMYSESDKRTDSKLNDFKQELEDKEKAKDEAEVKKQEAKRKEQTKTIEEQRKNFDKDWYDLVKQGKMPKVAKEVQEKINKGEKLSREEIEKDEGLSARLKLARVKQTSGKATKVAFYEDFDKQPVGAKAPVLGTRPSTPQSSNKDEYSYEDIRKGSKRLFGH